MGGGYAAIADDPTAVWHNPAGLAIYGDNVGYLGAELVVLDRAYTPDAQSPLGASQATKTIHENTGPTFIPVSARRRASASANRPATRFAFGILVYDAYGGSISYNPTDLSKTDMATGMSKVVGISSTQITDLRADADARLSGQRRLLHRRRPAHRHQQLLVNDTESAFSAVLVRLGRRHRRHLRRHAAPAQAGADRRGLSHADERVDQRQRPVHRTGSPPGTKDFGLNITWPQSAGLGVTVFPHKRLLATVQADWTAWSSIQKLGDRHSGGLAGPKRCATWTPTRSTQAFRA